MKRTITALSLALALSAALALSGFIGRAAAPEAAVPAHITRPAPRYQLRPLGGIKIDDMDVPVHEHALAFYKATAPDCEKDGNVAYWYCVVCERLFADAEGETQIEDVTDPALGHELTHVAEEAPGCETEGQVEHWLCSRCGKAFADPEGDTELGTVVLAAKGHVLTHVDAVAAGCETTGVQEHWACAVCGKTFSDSAGTAELADVTVAAAGHTWGDWTVATAPGCETTGTERRVCTKDTSHIETRPSARIPISPGHKITTPYPRLRDLSRSLSHEMGKFFSEKEREMRLRVVYIEENSYEKGGVRR